MVFEGFLGVFQGFYGFCVFFWWFYRVSTSTQGVFIGGF